MVSVDDMMHDDVVGGGLVAHAHSEDLGDQGCGDLKLSQPRKVGAVLYAL